MINEEKNKKNWDMTLLPVLAPSSQTLAVTREWLFINARFSAFLRSCVLANSFYVIFHCQVRFRSKEHKQSLSKESLSTPY